MKIIVLTSSLDLGGTERVVASLCNDWAARGDRVTLIATFAEAGPSFYPIADAVELIYLANAVRRRNVSVLRYLEKLRGLRRLLKERAADVIVSFLPNVNVAAILSSAFIKTPLIICERSDPSGYTGFHVLKSLRKLTYRFADILTVQTQGLADKAEQLYPGVKAVCVIPNALPDGVACRDDPVDGDRKILLSLGRLAAEKQVGQLIEAFAAIAPAFEDWDLHIYGDGPLMPALQAQIHDARLERRAFLKGPTDRPWDVMAHADAFVMMSRYEGFPNALLEAMGTGLPCVVFDCPSGPREISRDGKDALLIPLDDFKALLAALQRLMGDRTLRLALGRQGCESVHRRFGHQQVMAMWDELFADVGAVSRAPGPGRMHRVSIDNASVAARS